MNKIIRNSIITVFIGFIISFFLINITVSADTISNRVKELVNSANTYDLDVEDFGDHCKFIFDKNKKNTNVVDTKPSITFVTHGLSGSAGDVSRKYDAKKKEFGYNERSVVNLIAKKTASQIYVIEFESEFSYKVYKADGDTSYTITEVEPNIDITKHTIVVFDGYNSSEGNDYIYSQFNIGASYFINLIKEKKGGILPKVNLIGHSRGGLTNLQFALDHPDLIDSMYSISTPYLGTTIDTINYNCITPNGRPIEDNGGTKDIQDEEIYMSYYNRWNDNYDELYKNIKAHALGMYQDLSMFLYQLSFSFLFYDYIGDYTSEISIIFYLCYPVLARLVKTIVTTIEVFNGFSQYMKNEKGQEALDKLLGELKVLSNGDVEFKFDGLVDIDSQLGINEKYNLSYKGFERFSYKLNFFTDADFRYTARVGVIVTHAATPYLLTTLEYIDKTIRV